MSGTRATFRQWRHGRPFAGGVCLAVSAAFIALPTLKGFRMGDLMLTVASASGVSTLWLAILMGLCAVAVLFWTHVRVVAGVCAMVIALVAFPAANFGGYLLGTLIGIVGAALTLAWQKLPAGVDTDVDTDPTDPDPTDADPTDAGGADEAVADDASAAGTGDSLPAEGTAETAEDTAPLDLATPPDGGTDR